MSIIRTANQQPRLRQLGLNYRGYIEHLVWERWKRKVNWETGGQPLKAWINYSNWSVTCDMCNESVVAEPSDPVFYCPNCENAANGYRARPVEFPDQDTKHEIERLLLLRPNPDTRTWYADETLDDLKKQNLEHGIGV